MQPKSKSSVLILSLPHTSLTRSSTIDNVGPLVVTVGSGVDYVATVDTALHLHCSAFDPKDPLKNMIAYNDDADLYFQPIFKKQDGVIVNRGTTYWLVVQQSQSYQKQDPIWLSVRFQEGQYSGKVLDWKDLDQCSTDGNSCSDGDPMTHDDTCKEGVCVPGRPTHPDCGGFASGIR